MLAHTAKSTGHFPRIQKGKKATLLSKSKSSHPSKVTDAKQNSTEIKRHQRIPVEALNTFYYRSKTKVHNEND